LGIPFQSQTSFSLIIVLKNSPKILKGSTVFNFPLKGKERKRKGKEEKTGNTLQELDGLQSMFTTLSILSLSQGNSVPFGPFPVLLSSQ